MSESTSACDRYPLHRAVFEGNLRKVSSLLRDHDIGERDCHGMSSNIQSIFICLNTDDASRMFLFIIFIYL